MAIRTDHHRGHMAKQGRLIQVPRPRDWITGQEALVSEVARHIQRPLTGHNQ